MTTAVQAAQTVTYVTDGDGVFVNISQKGINLIKFPVEGTEVYTKSKQIDARVSGKNILVSFTGGDADTEIQDVMFITPVGSYSMSLKPMPIPAETIIVKLPKVKVAQLAQKAKQDSESSDSGDNADSDYIRSLKELMKGLYVEVAPQGYSPQEYTRAVKKWAGLKSTLTLVFSGPAFDGERYKIKNITQHPITLSPPEFYQVGTLAVSLDNEDLAPSEETDLYVIRKSDMAVDTASKLKKFTPLNFSK